MDDVPRPGEVRVDPLTGLRAIVGGDPVSDDRAAELEGEANRDLFWAGPAVGAHEVIVNASAPVRSLGELPPAEVAAAAERWRERMRAHAAAACLHLTVDEAGADGAAPAPSQAELYALDFVPAAVARERERFGAYATRTMGGNLLADLVREEVRRRERIVSIDDECVLMSAFGARAPYELMIAPRRVRARFEDDGPTGARMLHDALGRLRRRLGDAPALSLWVRTAPRGAEHFCWHIDIVPRVAPAGGLAIGAGVAVNPVAPEQAAAELREA